MESSIELDLNRRERTPNKTPPRFVFLIPDRSSEFMTLSEEA